MSNLISVIVPVYNVEKQINDTLNSLINQTYKNLEIILVDDGSTDNSGKICDEFANKDKRIKVFHKENGGASNARNFGLRHSAGEYINFIDSDDYIELDAYERLINIINTHNPDVIRYSLDEEKNGVITKQRFVFEKDGIIEKDLVIDAYLNNKVQGGMPNIFFKRSLLDDGLKIDESIVIGEDLLFTFEIMCKAQTIYFTSDCLYHYRDNNASLTKSKANYIKNLNDYILIYFKLIELLKKYDIYTNEKDVEVATSRYIHMLWHFKERIIKNSMISEGIEKLFEDEKYFILLEKVDKTKLSTFNKVFLDLSKKNKRILKLFCNVKKILF